MGKRIEELDRKIVELLAERCRLHVEELKNLPPGEALYSAARAKELSSFLETLDTDPLSPELIKKIFGELTAFSLGTVKPPSVAYLGPEGTFTHSAMLEVFGSSAAGIPVRSIHDVFVEVETGRAEYGVVPVENSTEGAVTYTLDELMDTELKITAEKYLRVSYSLVSVAKDMKSIKKLYSHPQSFGQCKEWIRKNLPNVEMHNVSSTSLAAETASWTSSRRPSLRMPRRRSTGSTFSPRTSRIRARTTRAFSSSVSTTIHLRTETRPPSSARCAISRARCSIYSVLSTRREST